MKDKRTAREKERQGEQRGEPNRLQRSFEKRKRVSGVESASLTLFFWNYIEAREGWRDRLPPTTNVVLLRSRMKADFRFLFSLSPWSESLTLSHEWTRRKRKEKRKLINDERACGLSARTRFPFTSLLLGFGWLFAVLRTVYFKILSFSIHGHYCFPCLPAVCTHCESTCALPSEEIWFIMTPLYWKLRRGRARHNKYRQRHCGD